MINIILELFFYARPGRLEEVTALGFVFLHVSEIVREFLSEFEGALCPRFVEERRSVVSALFTLYRRRLRRSSQY